jgi:hypothetical protein
MCLRAGPGAVEKGKNLAPDGILTPAVQSVARCYTDWAIPALFSLYESNANFRKWMVR